jgi:threonylcarbamoyladenosine tRNA methylthiotransferase MtaB
MNQYKKVAFYTLGCKLNFSETSTISRLFDDAGFAKVDFEETPDIYIINTCSVTENADKKCRQLVKRAMKINPQAFVAIIGCYAQLKPEEIGKIPGVDIVLGANEKFNLIEHIAALEAKQEQAILSYTSIKETTEFIPSFSYGDRTRSFLKVQDGCDYFCTFCTIPLARGKSRNASISETILEAEKIAKTDIKEVVLTGVNIGDFGQGGNENFFQLVKALDQVKGIDRFRISSIEPNLLSNEIISFCLNDAKRFVPHFHVPLQSGNDRLLKAMRRKYERSLYAERVSSIKSLRADACIGVDVIVGSPGETEAYFKESFDFIHSLDISYLHVFTYSERAMTKALEIKPVVPISVRNERNKILRNLSYQKQQYFNAQHIGHTRPVLFESIKQKDPSDIPMLEGYSDNYIRITTPFRAEWSNQIVDWKIN